MGLWWKIWWQSIRAWMRPFVLCFSNVLLVSCYFAFGKFFQMRIKEKSSIWCTVCASFGLFIITCQVVTALDCLDELWNLTNGMKPGLSSAFDSAQQFAQIRMFRRMAFGSQDRPSFFNKSFLRRIWICRRIFYHDGVVGEKSDKSFNRSYTYFPQLCLLFQLLIKSSKVI